MQFRSAGLKYVVILFHKKPQAAKYLFYTPGPHQGSGITCSHVYLLANERHIMEMPPASW